MEGYEDVRNVGGEEFFYLTEERVRQLSIPREFLYPLLPSPRYLRFFTFTKNDWEELKREGASATYSYVIGLETSFLKV